MHCHSCAWVLNYSALRYRFSDFILSPSRRTLFRDGKEAPLIPRYFDLLLLLIARRNEAVHRQEILDAVWKDVIVSDGALTQAIRTLRRALGDDSKDPVFIRTVSRHGYRFVFADVVEESDDTPLSMVTPTKESDRADPATPAIEDAWEAALARLLAPSSGSVERTDDDDDRREASEALHLLGTSEALRRLGRQKGHAKARALLRDSRWDVPTAGPVPLLGEPGGAAAAYHLVVLRLRRALHLAGGRWAAAATGGALAGLVAGFAGGVVLRFGPGSVASNGVLIALAMVGFVIGGAGAAGVGAGLAVAEALFRSFRGPALVVMGALGGGTIGLAAHLLGRLTLEGLFGRDLSPVAGGFEGVIIGGAAGFGYGLGTPRAEGGMATPRGNTRLLAALITGVCCSLGAMWLGWRGSYLGAMSLDFMAHSFPGSQVSLDPLARLLGESSAGPLTRTAISAGEGLMFGFGLALGLTYRSHRPRRRRSTAPIT